MHHPQALERRVIIGLAMFLGFCVTVDAREITVCKQGCEHKVINSAVAAAASGDTVSIGPGTYFENVVISNKNLTVTGYSEDYTVIDGGFQGATLSINGSAPSQNTVNLIKLTVTHGSASGVVIDGATVSLQKVVVISNLSASNGAGPGGGINAFNSVIHITNSIIAHNRAPSGDGGGVFGGGNGALSPSSFTIVSSILSGNEAYSGGGISLEGASTATLTSSSITGNSAVDGGGAYLGGFRHIAVEVGAFLTMNGSTIADNHAAGSGGGVYVGLELPQGTFNNSFIVGNSAEVAGGGISLSEDGSVTLSNTLLTGNTPNNCNDPFGSNCPR
jgi:hypothetical protein